MAKFICIAFKAIAIFMVIAVDKGHCGTPSDQAEEFCKNIQLLFPSQVVLKKGNTAVVGFRNFCLEKHTNVELMRYLTTEVHYNEWFDVARQCDQFRSEAVSSLRLRLHSINATRKRTIQKLLRAGKTICDYVSDLSTNEIKAELVKLALQVEGAFREAGISK